MLSSPDGGVVIEGELQSFDGRFYRMETPFGPLTVEASGVTCVGTGCPDPGKLMVRLRFAGPASISGRLLPELIEAFASDYALAYQREVIDDGRFSYLLQRDDLTVAEFSIVLEPGDLAIERVDAGEADVALLREAPPDFGRASKFRADILALDALVPVTSAASTLTMLSREDLAKVLSGRIETWEILTGESADLNVHLGTGNTGTTREIERQILSSFGWALAENTTRHGALDALVDAVAEDPFALGVTTLSELGATVPLVLTGPCGYPTVASPLALKTEDYPLTKPIFLVSPALGAPGLGGAFLRYIRSPDAQPVIAFAGFVDQRIARIPFAIQGGRLSNAILASSDESSLVELQRMMESLNEAARLSVTFRFEPGSSQLDTASRSNVGLLADAMARGEFEGEELVFVGFSDGRGDADVNLRLSRERARGVAEAVAGAAGGTIDSLIIEGFGEAMPIACDEVEWGRSLNRRVEVWVR